MLLLVPSLFAAPLGNLEVFTSFPTDVGLRGTFEGPGRLRATGSVGLVPRPYLDAINQTAIGAGWYPEDTAALIDVALDRAVVFRAHLGWRPFKDRGFQFEVGYSYLGLGGGATGAEIIEIEKGWDLSAVMGDEFPFLARAEAHRVEASFGWEYVIRDHFLIRWDLGGSYTVNAAADIDRDFYAPWPLSTELDRIESEVEGEVVDALEQFVHTPIFALGVGWRFQ